MTESSGLVSCGGEKGMYGGLDPGLSREEISMDEDEGGDWNNSDRGIGSLRFDTREDIYSAETEVWEVSIGSSNVFVSMREIDEETENGGKSGICKVGSYVMESISRSVMRASTF